MKVGNKYKIVSKNTLNDIGMARWRGGKVVPGSGPVCNKLFTLSASELTDAL